MCFCTMTHIIDIGVFCINCSLEPVFETRGSKLMSDMGHAKIYMCSVLYSIPVHVIPILRSRSRYAMICNSCNYHIPAFTISKQMVLFCSPPICSMKHHGSLHLPKDLRANWEDTVLFWHF